MESVAEIRKSYQWLEKAGLKDSREFPDHGSTTTGSEYKSDRSWDLPHQTGSGGAGELRSP